MRTPLGSLRRMAISLPPITFQRRVEHFAEPVDDHRLFDLRQDAVVHARVALWRLRAGHQRAAGHEDDAAAELLDRSALGFVGGNDFLDGELLMRRQVVRAGPRSDEGTRYISRCIQSFLY